LESQSLDQFLSTEETCTEFNKKLDDWFTPIGSVTVSNSKGSKVRWLFKDSPPAMVKTLISSASYIVGTILGDCPTLSELEFKFGPGNSTSVSKTNNGGTTSRYKLDAVPKCGPDAIEFVSELYDTIPYYAYCHSGKCSVGGSYLSFVPKSAKALRSILTEPLLNMPVQKGIGSFFKKQVPLYHGLGFIQNR